MNTNRETTPESWVEEHGDYLFRYAIGRVRDVNVAEEILQETFLAALKSRKRYEGRASVRTWLVGILKHKIIDHFRKSAKVCPVADICEGLDGSDRMFDGRGRWSAEPGEWGRNPYEAAESGQFLAVLKECLGDLPDGLANAFMLREVEGMSSEEVCRELGITANNLWVRLHRARQQLRVGLEQKWYGDAEETATVTALSPQELPA